MNNKEYVYTVVDPQTGRRKRVSGEEARRIREGSNKSRKAQAPKPESEGGE